MKIRKCIIPVAGYGTRFLPATKALPKEMLPILDKPVVQYIVEEAVASGIEDIILVTGQNKRAVEDHFDYHPDLEDWLKTTGKHEQLNAIREIAKLANFIYIRQKGPYGNGTPILNARHLIGDEPFVVVWGDDLFLGRPPRIRQLVDVYSKYQDPVLGAIAVTSEDTKRYGIIEGRELESGVYQVNKLKEKPGPTRTKSRLGSVGGYVLTPEIFDVLATTPLRDHELWLADAIDRLLKKRAVYARRIDAEYFDIGSKLGWLQANIALSMRDSQLRIPLRETFKRNLK